MKIYELIKILNKKVQVKDKKVAEVKKHYLSLYRAYMVTLYDKGYISDPTVFNTKEIRNNIIDLGIKYITGIDGRVELSEAYISYALARHKDDEDISEFLECLLNAVKYRNISMNIDKFYDESNFTFEQSKKISINLTQSASRIRTKCGFDIDEGVLKCVKPLGTGVTRINFNRFVYKTALRELGIEYNKDSLFVKGLTVDEEIEHCKLILNGLVKLDGPYADKLMTWLGNNKWAEGNRFSSQNEGLYNWVVFVNSNEMIDEQSRFMNHLLDNGYEILSMESDGFYVSNNYEEVLYPVGVFSVLGDDEGSILPNKNIVEGYTGEVYSISYLVDNELSFVGCPIELYIDDKNKDFFIDKEQTELKDSVSWFKHNEATISFTESSYKEGVFQAGSLEDDLYKVVCDADEGVLVGSLKPEARFVDLNNVKKAVAKKF